MKTKVAPIRLVLMAIVAALWVLTPALPAHAHEDGTTPPGEWKVGEDDGTTNDDRGTGGGGGLNADPDTFEIDQRFGPEIGALDGSDASEGALNASFWFRFLNWLVASLQEMSRAMMSAGR